MIARSGGGEQPAYTGSDSLARHRVVNNLSHWSLLTGYRSLSPIPVSPLEKPSVDPSAEQPAEHWGNDVHRPPPSAVHLEGNATPAGHRGKYTRPQVPRRIKARHRQRPHQRN